MARPACSRSQPRGGPATVLTRPDPRAGRSRPRVAGAAAGRPGRALHHHGGHGRPRRRTSGRPGSADGNRTAVLVRGRQPSAALRAERPSRLRRGRRAAGGAVRPGPPGDARHAGAVVPQRADDRPRRTRTPWWRATARWRTCRGASATGGVQRTLVWVDRQGRETPIPAPPRALCLSAPVTRRQARRGRSRRSGAGRLGLGSWPPHAHPRRPSTRESTTRPCGRATARADLQFGARRHPESLLAAGQHDRARSSGSAESASIAARNRRVTRRPRLIFTERRREHGRRHDAARLGRTRVPSRRSCSPRLPSGTASSRPTAAGWPTRRTTRAGSRSPCGPFPT